MPLLTTGNFYSATFHPTTHPAWAALGNQQPSGIQADFAQALYTSVPAAITFYVVHAPLGQIAYVNGNAYGLDDSLLNQAESISLFKKFTLEAIGGDQVAWANDGTGGLWYYDGPSGLLRSHTSGDITAFQAFIAAV